MTVLAWSPLRSGWLTGKYLPENKGEGGSEARLNAEMMKGWVPSMRRLFERFAKSLRWQKSWVFPRPKSRLPGCVTGPWR